MKTPAKKLKIMIVGLKPRQGKMLQEQFKSTVVFNLFDQERKYNIPGGQDFYIVMTKFCSHFNQELIKSKIKSRTIQGKMLLHRGGMSNLESLIKSILPPAEPSPASENRA